MIIFHMNRSQRFKGWASIVFSGLKIRIIIVIQFIIHILVMAANDTVQQYQNQKCGQQGTVSHTLAYTQDTLCL